MYLSSEENENKEEFQQTIQTKAEEIGGGREGSLITRPQEVLITEAPKKEKRIAKAKHPTVKRESYFTKSDIKISKQPERQADQLARIEKVLLPLQKSVNKIDKQSNTIKQLYTEVTELQRQMRSTKNQKQIQDTQKKKKGKKLASRSKRRSLKGRRQR